MPPTLFEEIQRIAEVEGYVAKTLDLLEHHFRRDQAYFKLFEVLKMRHRHRLGLPLIHSANSPTLSESRQRELEDGLLAACREVGTLLCKAGQVREGWMYLQPVGDTELAEKLIRAVPIDEENLDTIVDVAVSQGAAPAYGFELLLKHFGTCNGITTFDTQAQRFDIATQRQMASALLTHLYGELMANVRYAIEQQAGTLSEDSTLSQAMQQHPQLTQGGAHHIDTTHLASLMRIARSVTDREQLIRAKELADYGATLDSDFQYPSPPPFEKTYVDHQFFYGALLGERVDEAIAHFRSKIESVEPHMTGVAIETFIDLLIRVDRCDEAIDVMTTQWLGQHEPVGLAPNLLEIATTPKQLQKAMAYYESQVDVLGYAASLLHAKEAK